MMELNKVSATKTSFNLVQVIFNWFLVNQLIIAGMINLVFLDRIIDIIWLHYYFEKNCSFK